MAGYHVRQRGKKGRWYAVIDAGRRHDGTRDQRWIALDPSITTKREAEAAARKLAVQRDQDELPNDRHMTVAALMGRWMEATADKRKQSTTYQYESRIRKYINPGIGNMRVSEVRRYHIEEFLDKITRKPRRRAGLAPQTVGIIHSMLHSAFDWAVKHEIISRNPVDLVPKPRGDSKPKRILTDEEFRRLTSALAGTRLAAPALILGTTGIRRGELLALRWSDVDLDNGVLHVRENLVRVGRSLAVDQPKSRTSIRDIPLPALAVDALRVYRIQQEQRRREAGAGWIDRDLVFDNGLGDYWRPTTFSSAFADAAKRAGFPNVTPHCLRHGYASIVYEATGDMKLVQELLGHSSMNVTSDIYTHIFEARKRQAAAAIQQIFTVSEAPEAPQERPVH